MPLSSHLDNPNSPVLKFLQERFPNTQGFATKEGKKLKGLKTILPTEDVPNGTYGTIGTAIDYRVRYYIQNTPYKKLVAWKGARGLNSLKKSLVEDFFISLERMMGEVEPIGRRLSNDIETRLNRYCFVLALFEQLFRNPNIQEHPFRNSSYRDIESLLAIPEQFLIDDLSALSGLFFEKCGPFFSHKWILNPEFSGSSDIHGADADLIVDRLLIEIKTTITPREWKSWFYQLLGYVLLDYEDTYRFNRIGIYFTRQGKLVIWNLREFMTELAGGKPPAINELRSDMRKILRDIIMRQNHCSP